MANSKKTIRIDELGRVVIPIDMRRKLDIHTGDMIDVTLDGHTINIVKTDTSYIENYIHDIEVIAWNSNHITSKEYASLCGLLNKLKGGLGSK